LELVRPTPRQVDILRELVQGKKVAAVARELDLTHATVKSHLGRLYVRVLATGAPHAVYRVHNRWPLMLGDLEPEGPAPTFSDLRSALLWHVSQGELVKVCGARYGLTEDSVKAHMRAAYRALGANCAAQAVHNAYVLGVLKAPGEIR
jgi:DNA-binding NarL/FixJ family response regulator